MTLAILTYVMLVALLLFAYITDRYPFTGKYVSMPKHFPTLYSIMKFSHQALLLLVLLFIVPPLLPRARKMLK